MDGNNTVWVYDIARSTMSRLAFGFDNNVNSHSPDGRRVTISSNRDGTAWNLYWQVADGSRPAERLTTSEYSQFGGSWTPDGKHWVVWETRHETHGDLWVLSMDGERTTRPFLQTEFDENQAEFSPDGRWIAYMSDESGRPEVYIRPFPSGPGKWPASTDGGADPRWNGNGQELFYRRGDKMMVVGVRAEGDRELPSGKAKGASPVTPCWRVVLLRRRSRWPALRHGGRPRPAAAGDRAQRRSLTGAKS